MRQSAAVYRNVDADEAARLLARDAVRVLDVRTADEYDTAGHIPGANLLPVDLIAAAPATLPRDGKPLLVYCQHGIRSVTASRFLAAAGFSDVMNLVGGLSCWRGPREHGPASADRLAGPSSWLVQNADLLPRRGKALDVACGSGRHALLLSAAGLSVRAVDRDAEAIGELKAAARRLGFRVETEIKDLETGSADLGDEVYDIVLVVNYLHRPLFPVLDRASAGWVAPLRDVHHRAGRARQAHERGLPARARRAAAAWWLRSKSCASARASSRGGWSRRSRPAKPRSSYIRR